jgi:uncharacterized membrane protein YhaH (DUF805 family)
MVSSTALARGFAIWWIAVMLALMLEGGAAIAMNVAVAVLSVYLLVAGVAVLARRGRRAPTPGNEESLPDPITAVLWILAFVASCLAAILGVEVDLDAVSGSLTLR